MIVRRLLVCALFTLAAGCPSSQDRPPDVPADCNLPIAKSSMADGGVLELGTKKVGEQVQFDVPPNTASVTIVHQSKSSTLNIVYKGTVLDNSAVPATINLPDGTTVYSDSDPCADPPSPDGGTPPPTSDCSNPTDPATHLAFYGGGTPATAAFTVPNTSAGVSAWSSGVPAGKWSFVVNDYAYECSAGGCDDGGTDQNTYDMSVLLKPVSTTTNVDVAFYIVGNATGTLGPLTASTAPNEPYVKRMVQTYKSLFANGGITVRNVTFYDVSSADKTRFGTNINADKNGPCDELDQMFTLSSAHPGNPINLFLVQSISSTDTGGGSVVGIDGTIPGPASLNGTVHSGAAVSMANLFSGTCTSGSMSLATCGADDVAYIAAHETGHFLGLFHTTESTGDSFDPLTDTSKCPCLSCGGTNCMQPSSSTPPSLSARQCGPSTASFTSPCPGGGGTNLMFWQFDRSVSQGLLSAQQAQVMKTSPAVQ